MARIHYYQWVQSHVSGATSLAVAANASVYVYLAGTTTEATIFAGEATSASVITQPILTNSSGYFEFWIDDSYYTYQTQKFKIVISKTGYTGITVDNINAQMPPNNLLGLTRLDPSIEIKGIEVYGPIYETKQGGPAVEDSSAYQQFRILEENGVFKLQYNLGSSTTYEVWTDILSYSMWGRLEVYQKGFLRIPGLTDILEGIKARLLFVEERLSTHTHT